MRQQFSKEMQSLDAVFNFLERFSEAEGLDAGISYVLALAVEEFFTNIVKYGKGPARDILLDAVREGNTATIRLEEETPEPFDVTRPTETQFEIPAMERRPGGLGIYLSKEMLDGLTYEYANGISRITLTKHVEKQDDVQH